MKGIIYFIAEFRFINLPNAQKSNDVFNVAAKRDSVKRSRLSHH